MFTANIKRKNETTKYFFIFYLKLFLYICKEHLKQNDMKTFILTLQSDQGTHKIRTTAQDQPSAAAKVCHAENCPLSAILLITPVIDLTAEKLHAKN